MHFNARSLSKQYQGKTILFDVEFAVRQGDLVSVVGPSGVGKTTLLRIIAGLESPTSGEIEFSSPPSRERPAILVFQDYQLFPNLTVAQNVEFGLQVRKVARRERQNRVWDILGEFDMQAHARNFPNQLSAGQKQRVALARAMVVRPSLLLLDEPFANLDPSLKMQTAEFIRQTQKRFDVTTVSVTHDLEEAYYMSDHVGLLLDGTIVQYCGAQELYRRPISLEAARFLGPVNVLPGRVLAQANGSFSQVVYARPEGVTLEPDSSGPGIVTSAGFAGHFYRYRVQLYGTELIAYSACDGLKEGDQVRVRITDQMIFTGGA